MTLLADLAAVVGESHVLADPDLVASFATDWTRRFSGSALAVCSPANASEVAGVLAVCGDHRIPVVPQGGNTGLVGGGVPGDVPSVILSTRRLTEMEPVDVVGREVTVGAGATIADLHACAHEVGLSYGVDLSSRDSATVGGTIATDAGGIRVCAFGTTRAQVLGVEAVLADGTIVNRLRGPLKDSGGYDLTQLLTASEGTLAVITAARLRLIDPLPPDRMTALVPVQDLDEAVALIRPNLLAAEYIESPVMELTGGPTNSPAWVLLEAVDLEVPDNAIGASDSADRSRIWQWREGATEAVSRLGVPTKLDVALPLRELVAFRTALAGIGSTDSLFVWGHLAEGNLHVNVIGGSAEDVTDHILGLVAKHHGAISSEHGIGRAKRDWLSLTRTSDELEVMARIKNAFDPTGLLNPGVLVEGGSPAVPDGQ